MFNGGSGYTPIKYIPWILLLILLTLLEYINEYQLIMWGWYIIRLGGNLNLIHCSTIEVDFIKICNFSVNNLKLKIYETDRADRNNGNWRQYLNEEDEMVKKEKYTKEIKKINEEVAVALIITQEL